MKVGIITFHFVSNYGGVLQAYALQTFLEKNGHEAFIINYRPYYHTNRYAAIKNPFTYSAWYWKKFSNRKLLKRLRLTARSFIRCVVMDLKRTDKETEDRFNYFIKSHLHETKAYTTYGKLQNDPPLADAYISGSDQLWNPDILDRKFDPAYFLEFGPQIPKITYAVSTGRDLKDEEKIQLRSLCKGLTAVALREFNQEVISAIGKDTHICLDPTLLLDAGDYAGIESGSVETDPYIFVYGFEDTAELKRAVNLAQNKYGCKIINGSPHRIKLYQKQVINLRNYAPGQFLTLIKNAQCIVTNSFHGTAFSVIYHKEFITVSHSVSGSRMVSLLTTLELTSRLWGSENFNFDGKVNFDAVEKIRKEVRSHSENYLLTAIRGVAGEKIPHYTKEFNKPEWDNTYKRGSGVHISKENHRPEESLPVFYNDRRQCCGCSACYSVCPAEAISMKEDGEGFLYPVIDSQKCIRCYRCLSVCAFKRDQRFKGYF